MKVVVDLVEVRQSWKPDTNTHHNTAVIIIGGKTIEVECTEDEVRTLVATTVRQAPTQVQPEDDTDLLEEEDTTASNGDEVFGGDFDGHTVPAPSLFQSEPGGVSLDDAVKPPPAPARPPPPKNPGQQREDLIDTRRQNDPSARRQETKTALRARAQQTPPRRVDKDEMGNPIVRPADRPILGSAGAPEVIHHRQAPPVGGTDDDGFAQG